MNGVLALVAVTLVVANGFLLAPRVTPHTVKHLDPVKYLGRWYQTYSSASVANLFERGAQCVTADYGLLNSTRISVLNAEQENHPSGHLKVIHGHADMTGVVGQLRVSLEGVPFGAPYWVLKLGPATYGPNKLYQYSIVSDNVEGTMFLLVRDVKVFEAQYEAECLQFLKTHGFTSFYNHPVKTYQGSDCVYSKNITDLPSYTLNGKN